MHRSVAATSGAFLVPFGAYTQHPLAMLAMVGVGLVFLGIAIVGRPKPRLALLPEIAALLGAATVTVSLIALGAYLDR